MLSNGNAAGGNGDADKSSASNSQSSSHNTAEAILAGLACGRSGCPCVASERRGHGLTHCPAHEDSGPSLNVSQDRGYVLVHCFARCEQDAVIEALREHGLWQSAPAARRNGLHRAAVTREVRHELRDETGEVVAVHIRRVDASGKKIAGPWWELPDGTKSLNNRRVETLPLFGIDHLGDLPDGVAIILVEGEPARDALYALGIANVATVCGAAVTPTDEVLRLLVRFRVYLWPDNDEAGRPHMTKIAARLVALGGSVSTMKWPDAPEKGDAADFVTQGGTADDVRVLMDAAEAWQPPKIEDGAVLLDDLVAFVRRYVILTEAQADAVALWGMHTHALDAADATPYLSITSAEKRSGKTRLLEVLEPTVARPWFTGRVTSAVLIRKIDGSQPTLLLDESDAAFKGEKEYAETLRGILNNGHRRGAVVSLCVKAGGDFELRDFSVFGPKAFAGIGKLPDTITDRSIRIDLRRRAPGEHVDRFRHSRVKDEAEPLRERLSSWAAAQVDTLRSARPELPDSLDDRAQDGWEPLLAIADAVGGEWATRARQAAVALSTGDGREDDSFGVQLLRDIDAIFKAHGADRLASATLCAALNALEEAPWGDLRGKPLDPRRLAQMVKPYGIKPRSVRVAAATAKGYQREDFMDAWRRYLAYPQGPSQASQPSQRPDSDTDDVTAVTAVTSNTSMGDTLVCVHRPAGEANDLWARGDSTWGEDPHMCLCCGGPARGDLLELVDDGCCPTCRSGAEALANGGHLVRHALDAGLEIVLE